MWRCLGQAAGCGFSLGCWLGSQEGQGRVFLFCFAFNFKTYKVIYKQFYCLTHYRKQTSFFARVACPIRPPAYVTVAEPSWLGFGSLPPDQLSSAVLAFSPAVTTRHRRFCTRRLPLGARLMQPAFFFSFICVGVSVCTCVWRLEDVRNPLQSLPPFIP